MGGLERRKTPGAPGTYSGLVVEKVDSSADSGTSLYLRLSMGDYRIRCSGSGIAEVDLRGKVKSYVTLRGEIVRGEVQGLGGTSDIILTTGLVD